MTMPVFNSLGYITYIFEDAVWYLDIKGEWHDDPLGGTLMHHDFGAAIINAGDLHGPKLGDGEFDGYAKVFWTSMQSVIRDS